MLKQAKFFPDHPSNLPTGSVIDSNAIFRETQDQADYVIIGSGAAGGTAAQFLTEAGFSVIIIEEGPWIRTHQFGVDVYPGMKTLFREMGGQVANGRAPFPLIQGRDCDPNQWCTKIRLEAPFLRTRGLPSIPTRPLPKTI